MNLEAEQITIAERTRVFLLHLLIFIILDSIILAEGVGEFAFKSCLHYTYKVMSIREIDSANYVLF